MKSSLSIAVLGLLALAGQALAWKYIGEPQLRNALESNGYTLVAFVLPSQDASKALEREWTTVQEAVGEPDSIVSIDCGESLRYCKELDALSYPAIRLYHRDGRMDRYRGERKAAVILAFLRRSFRPAVFELTEESLPSFVTTADDVVFVAHLALDDDFLYERYRALAKQYRDRYTFAVAGPTRKIPGGASVVACYNNVDDEQHETAELGAVDALERFVELCARPLVPELTRRNEVEYTATGKSIMHFFTRSDSEKEQYRNAMRPLAKKYRDFLHFAVTDLNEYPDMLAAVGLPEGAQRGLALENPNTGDMFPYRGKKKITASLVEAFLNDVVDGKVESIAGGKGGGGSSGHDEL